MGFTELNEKIRDDYTRCLDTVLNGAQKIIDFMNKTAGKEQPTESSNGEFLNKFANAAIGAAIDNTPLKGLKMINKLIAPEAPTPPFKISAFEKDPSHKFIDWASMNDTINKTLSEVTHIRTIVKDSDINEDTKYLIELKLYEVQKRLHETLQTM